MYKRKLAEAQKPQPKKQSKRAGYLYEKICDLGNIRFAILEASKKKRGQRNVRKILIHIDYYAERIRKMLLDQTYIPSPYATREINDGIRQKKRTIAKPRFYPDQCIHHALIQVLEPVIMCGMYYGCCGSVKKRGDKRIRKYIHKFIIRHPEKTKYCLKMDVRHFYQSINHDALKAVLSRKIKDKRALWLCDVIIDSCPEGIPIGNYTSQWFCNLFLEDLDHKIKAFLGCGYCYTRYIDDMVIIGPSKRKLHKARMMIAAELKKKGLRLKGNWQVFRLKDRPPNLCEKKDRTRDRPLDFVGVKFCRGGNMTLRKSILKRIKRKAKKIGRLEHVNARNAAGMMAYVGRLHATDSERLFRTEIREHIKSTKRLRRIISNEARLRNRKTKRDLGRGAARGGGRGLHRAFQRGHSGDSRNGRRGKRADPLYGRPPHDRNRLALRP